MTIDAMGVDALVMRHSASGAAHQVAGWVDARHQCRRRNPRTPTQALLDAYTMEQRIGGLAGKHVVIVGDPHSRVFRSNVLSLRMLGADVTVVAPVTLMPSGIRAWSEADGFALSNDLDLILTGDRGVDALMMLRVQKNA